MLPKIISVSDFRKNMAKYLDMATKNLVVVKGKSGNKVVLDEKQYDYIFSLANQFILEDPEGKYRPEFEEEILAAAKENKYDTSIKSLSDLL